MAGNQEQRLRHLIAGASLETAIDNELKQWKNARDRLHEVGAALIAVSTPVSENLGKETVASALTAFKSVGEKVNERADDIQAIHEALQHAVHVTRQAQTAVAEMDGDQRSKPEFDQEPPENEADEMHDLKVYVGQMKLYNAWADAREQKSQEHADKVETAWQEAIAVMEKIPDDQTSGGGGGGGDDGGTGPVMPTAPTTPTTPTTRRRWTRFTPWEPPSDPTHADDPRPDADADAHPDADPGAARAALPDTPADSAGRRLRPDALPPGTPGTGPGFDPYPGSTPGVPGTPSTGDIAPTPAVSPGSLSGYAVGGAAGMGVLGGLGAGIRAASGATAASGGLRSGGILGASGRTAGSARGSLGARTGGLAAGGSGAASGRGTGRSGSRSAAGGRGSGAVGAGGGRGKDNDKKKRKPATVELFDEDKDWIDDEGASTGVID